ncbi:MAG: tyrosine-type recombinase/integrase [Gammaproteobacteria bacterium]
MFEIHWEDIDQVGGRIWVHRARVRLLVKGTKTPSSTRYVRILPGAKRALDLARPQSYLSGAHIFICLRSGLPWREEMLRLAWQRTCLRGGVRYRPAKHFRHTYAHRMLTAGEDLAFISRELGHKDLAVTARIYAGLLDEIGAGQDTFGQRANRMYGEDVPLSK